MKKLSLLLIFTLIITCFSCVAYAYETSFEIFFTPENGMVTLKGEASGVTTVRVAKSSIDPLSFSDGNLPADTLQFRANGVFTFDFYMPDGSEKTKYAIYLTDKNGKCKREFSYFIPTEANAIVKTLESCTQKSDFVKTAKSNAGSLGIDTEDALMEDVLSLMYDLYSSYDDSSDFYASYQYCRYISLLSGKDKAGVEELLKKYQAEYGIDYARDYENNAALSSDGKEKLCALLSSMYYADALYEAKAITGAESFAKVFECYGILADVITSEGWMALHEIYTADGSVTDEYVVSKNSSYKDENSRSVFSIMANMDFEKISDLPDNFNTAVKESQQSSSSKDKPSSGSGSGGGFGGGAISTPYANTENLYDAIGGEPVISPEASLPAFGGAGKSFWDVPQNEWYYDAVSILAGNNIISGDPSGSYRPNDPITRAEFAKLVVSTFSVEGKGDSFDDVPSDAWYAPFVDKASGASLIKGYEGKFSPEAAITRQDAAVILYRTAELLKKEYTGFENPADINDASLYAWTAIGAFYSNGIIAGTGNNRFEPLKNITRAETAQLIYKLVLDMTKNS